MRFIIVFSLLLMGEVCFAQLGQVNPECANCFTCTQLMSCFEDLVCADCDATNEIQSFSSPEGTIKIDQSDPLNIELDINLECCEPICESSFLSGVRYNNSNLPLGVTITDPINIQSLANTGNCEMVVSVFFSFPDPGIVANGSFILFAAEYQIFKNGVVVDGWRRAHEIIKDLRGINNTVTERYTLNAAENYNKIFALPGDVITAQQRVVINYLSDLGNIDEIVTINNGHTKISMSPRFIYAK